MAKMIKGFKTLAQAKGMATPSLRFRGDHKQMEQFTQHPSLTILFEFKSKTNELKTQSHLESSHGITSTSIMPSFKVIRQVKFHYGLQLLQMGCYSTPPPTQDLVLRSKPETTQDTQNGDDLRAPTLLPSPNDVPTESS